MFLSKPYYTVIRLLKNFRATHFVTNAQDSCQVFDSYVRSSNYALLAITKMPNNELNGIHTLSLSPLLL